ncbi:RNA 2',3'-cyclic phosphodiesterase [Colwellia sp. MEBiC06753]
MARYFFALDLSAQDKALLNQFQQQITPPLPKPTKQHNLHLTLVFLGQLDAIQLTSVAKAVNELAAKANLKTIDKTIKPVQLTTDQLGVFKQAKVLYLGLTHTPNWLTKLVELLAIAADELGINLDPRPYHPHITLSRKVTQLPEPLSKSLPNQVSFQHKLTFNSFSLYRSISTNLGVEYQAMQTWPINAS